MTDEILELYRKQQDALEARVAAWKEYELQIGANASAEARMTALRAALKAEDAYAEAVEEYYVTSR